MIPINTNKAPKIVLYVILSTFLKKIAAKAIVNKGYAETTGATTITGIMLNARYHEDTPNPVARPDIVINRYVDLTEFLIFLGNVCPKNKDINKNPNKNPNPVATIGCESSATFLPSTPRPPYMTAAASPAMYP